MNGRVALVAFVFAALTFTLVAAYSFLYPGVYVVKTSRHFYLSPRQPITNEYLVVWLLRPYVVGYVYDGKAYLVGMYGKYFYGKPCNLSWNDSYAFVGHVYAYRYYDGYLLYSHYHLKLPVKFVSYLPPPLLVRLPLWPR